MNMSELIAAAGSGQVTPRFVRFLVSEGVIPPPTGGRAHAAYDARHLHGVVNYGRLRKLGFSPTQAKEILRSHQGETVPLLLAPGVSLHIDVASLNPKIDPAAIAKKVEEAISQLLTSIQQERPPNADAA